MLTIGGFQRIQLTSPHASAGRIHICTPPCFLLDESRDGSRQDVPHLRTVEDELWQAVKGTQNEIAEKFVNVTAAVREHHSNKRINSARRPKSLFSGLVFCGRCDGPCSLRGADRFVCSAHVSNGSCSNGSTLKRSELEQRVLEG
ncbi:MULTISPECIES: zinc ribbon domain-containing protein [unclassified Bradyrhizobium]|uniref:zinc ribbon domain-containing protein n=1 Tax=unclassified Bradyrhizobium TaxID=2631580 RepID=UPI0024E16363|nr:MULTISPECIES: zinc ribbon domain-containing protein [unclassified Bradyrhizobium]